MPRIDPEILRELRAGIAQHNAGRLDTAEAAYRRALERDPNNPDALNLLGVILQDRGQPVRSVELISRALRRRRKFPEALTNLARAQRASGDPGGAVDSARRAVALAPDLVEAHIQLGRALIDLEDYPAAAEACRKAISLAPNLLDAHVNLAAALTRLKDYLGAAQSYQIAHALKPDRIETLTDFAVVLGELERHDDALRCIDRAMALRPNDPHVHASHAVALKKAQHVPASIDACRRALELSPDLLQVWYLLGSNMMSQGRFDEAVACYRKVLAADPGNAEAQRGIVAAGAQIDDETDLARLTAIAGDPTLPARKRIAAGFTLGSLLDKSGEFDAAFPHIAAANALVRAEYEAEQCGFDRRAYRQQIRSTMALFTPAVFAATRDWGDPSELPVFVVGMPRSGTTLAEQICASHPKVFGAGERQDIGRIAKTLNENAGGGPPTTWDRALVSSEAASHIARLRALGGDARRVVDKMPDNVLWLGLIAILFPNARIVICRRDLRDVCLSCYFQNFAAGLQWSNDLEDCAIRAIETERLMRHWRAVLPVPVMELQYEAMVADPEAESRRLIDFIGLPWDPACLAFHKTERTVLTASLWQVRQPLYTSSVGRWRHYRRHLGPLLKRLGSVMPTEAAA